MTDKLLMKKYLLIDLDGTLIDTADTTLKPMKDGQVSTDLSRIQVFEGATNFLAEAKSLGFECVILSDSHPKYVNPIVRNLFGNPSALSLTDKPNTLKTLNFLQELGIEHSKSMCYVLGDSWLDVELGRGLQVPTILTEFYEAKTLEIRDGIGDYVKNIRSGPTYFAKNYSEILEILRNPLQKLLSLEAGLQGISSCIARKPRPDIREEGKWSVHRTLARQAPGECDRYNVTDKYFEFNRADRSAQLLHAMRDSVIAYVDRILSNQAYSWEVFTYVPDKSTTQPPNKMGELFDLISEQIRQTIPHLACLNIFEWSDEVSSSTRKQPTAAERRMFVGSNLNLQPEVDVRGKSVIILDDQYTTGATADALTKQLQERGAQNVLFVALFHLVSPVNSSKLCPRCLANGLTKQLQIKIKRSDGSKFYSCVLPQYRGDGCGYTENIG